MALIDGLDGWSDLVVDFVQADLSGFDVDVARHFSSLTFKAILTLS